MQATRKAVKAGTRPYLAYVFSSMEIGTLLNSLQSNYHLFTFAANLSVYWRKNKSGTFATKPPNKTRVFQSIDSEKVIKRIARINQRLVMSVLSSVVPKVE